MPSCKGIMLAAVAGLATFGSALPALPKLSAQAVRRYEITKRQNAAAAAAGINDIDIAQFALTLENLETAFYGQGFSKFTDADFTAAGLTATDITNLKSIQTTEATHVTALVNGIAEAGIQPVQPCTYNFGFTTAQAMIATAGVLENIGVSAYLGAAPLVSTTAVLTLAAEIVTTESRHQTFIRTASKAAAIPSAFDTPLGVRSVFSLAAPFITSCPEGSNLKITPFPTLAQASAGTPVTIGSTLQLTTTGTGATACAFTVGGAPGGSIFTDFANGGCTVPQNLAGIAYVHLTSAKPADNVLTDAIIVAGVLVATIT